VTLSRFFRPVAAGLMLLSLFACGTSRGGYYLDDGPGDPSRVLLADAEPRMEPLIPWANRPYTALGQSYEPIPDAEGFSQEGMASWYGRRFQGRKTASGEPYDMYKMTAAHRRLPIPSYARVTALDSGKSVIVRINDRGPFHSNRVIDLSYAAAHKIGVTLKGTLRVRVESVMPGEQVQEEQPAPLPGDYLQIGAFSGADRANKLAARVQKRLKLPEQQVRVREDGGLYRVWLGPYPTPEDLDDVSGLLRERMGLEAVRVHSVSQNEEIDQ